MGKVTIFVTCMDEMRQVQEEDCCDCGSQDWHGVCSPLGALGEGAIQSTMQEEDSCEAAKASR